MENKNTIDFRNIKNQDELDVIFKSLSDQGFGYMSTYKIHNDKIKHIINKANKYDIESNKHSRETSELYKLKNYNDIESQAEKIFSKWSPDDKINEYLNMFGVISTIEVQYPSSNPSDKELIRWFKFKLKFKLKDSDFSSWERVYYYDLDKKTIKITFGDNKWDFRRMYTLLYKKECPEFSNKPIGVWVDLDNIQIKFYVNGNAELSGDVESYKKYQYEYLKNQTYATNIIKYNNKMEIFFNKNRD